MIYFTSDWHLLHDNNRGEGIIKYCNRPWKDVKQMGHDIIGNYNNIVTDDDEVYFIGDISLTRDKYYLERIIPNLRGTKHLILGNHDYLKPFEYIEIGFMSVHTSLELKNKFILNHDPAVAIMRPNSWFLCGHIHTLFKKIKNVLNVGIDVWNFKPVSWDEAIKEFE